MNPLYKFQRRLDGLKNRFDRCSIENDLLRLYGIEPRFLDHPVRGVANVLSRDR
jgi:hypothetical protein